MRAVRGPDAGMVAPGASRHLGQCDIRGVRFGYPTMNLLICFLNLGNFRLWYATVINFRFSGLYYLVAGWIICNSVRSAALPLPRTRISHS
jgi:hypothetical protein